jgi:hypothetical protein
MRARIKEFLIALSIVLGIGGIAYAIDTLPLGNPAVDGDTCIQANDAGTVKNSFCVDGATGNVAVLTGHSLGVDDITDAAGTGAPSFSNGISGAINVSGSGTFDSFVRVDDNAPSIKLMESDTTDQNWQWRVSSGSVKLQMIDDDGSTITINAIDVNTAGLVSIPNSLSVTGDVTATDQVTGDKGEFDTITNEAASGPPNLSQGIALAGTTVTASAAEINQLDDNTFDAGIGISTADNTKIDFVDPDHDDFDFRINATGLIVQNTTDAETKMIFSSGGNEIYIGDGSSGSTVRMFAGNGTVNTPMYSFVNAPDSGMWSPNDQIVSITADNQFISFADSGSHIQLRPGTGGSASFPTYSWDIDKDTGMYWHSSGQTRIQSNGTVAAAFTAAATSLRINASTGGTDLCSSGGGGTFSTIQPCTSSIRFKKDIEDLPIDRVNNIYNFWPVSFTWKENNEKDIGLIAEEVEKFYPEIMEYDPEGNILGYNEKHLLIVAVGALKLQKERIDDLELDKIDLQMENDSLKEKIVSIEERLSAAGL